MLPNRVYGIVGARDWTNYSELIDFVELAIKKFGPPAAFVSGGATGADKQGEAYAWEFYGFPTEERQPDDAIKMGVMNVFPPRWEGPDDTMAGKRRHTRIAELCDVLIALPTSSSVGTHDTIRKAKDGGKIVVERVVEEGE